MLAAWRGDASRRGRAGARHAARRGAARRGAGAGARRAGLRRGRPGRAAHEGARRRGADEEAEEEDDHDHDHDDEDEDEDEDAPEVSALNASNNRFVAAWWCSMTAEYAAVAPDALLARFGKAVRRARARRRASNCARSNVIPSLLSALTLAWRPSSCASSRGLSVLCFRGCTAA